MIRLKLAFAATALVFSSQALAQEAVRFSRLTTCETYAEVQNNGTPVDSVRVFTGGFSVSEGAARCERLVHRKATRLCKINNRNGKVADKAVLVWGFKNAVIDDNPAPSPCTSPTDPRCFDPLLQAFKFETIAANLTEVPCSQIKDLVITNETADKLIEEIDIER